MSTDTGQSGGKTQCYSVDARPAIMSRKRTRDTPPIQSLDRGLTILEAVAQSPSPVPLKQLTDLIGIDRSSVFRLANTLRQRRFLTNPKGSKGYVLGPTAWRLSHKYGRIGLGTFFHEHLRQLTTTLGETSHLGVREGNHALFIDDHTPTAQVVSVSGQTGELVPLYCTAHGKALIADMDLEALKALLGHTPLHAYTRNTIVSLAKLARACAQTRRDGYAIDDAEYSEELRCIAAPIRDASGEIVASVGISAPVTRFPRQRFATAAADVIATARAISARLSG
jgi:IclR family transcriptional regulator, acetate operon repressor